MHHHRAAGRLAILAALLTNGCLYRGTNPSDYPVGIAQNGVHIITQFRTNSARARLRVFIKTLEGKTVAEAAASQYAILPNTFRRFVVPAGTYNVVLQPFGEGIQEGVGDGRKEIQFQLAVGQTAFIDTSVQFTNLRLWELGQKTFSLETTTRTLGLRGTEAMYAHLRAGGRLSVARMDEFRALDADAPNQAQGAGGSPLAQRLLELKQLLDQGLITKEEYDTMRKRIIDGGGGGTG